jgi:8-oxo-dGTP pyrophosphatase MutT (NUDIX family)
MTNSQTDAKPTIPSATVMIVRDGADGLEVFMLVRNRMVDFASGALVFPGGKVDASDRDPAWGELALLDAPHPERSIWVSALRETFEETGLLLANHSASGDLVDAREAIRITSAAQTAIADGSRRFAELIAAEGLALATQRMVPFAHWITPVTMPKRFDTHFFLAEAPAGQIAVHDGGETVESVWIQPLQAIREAEAGTRTLVPATTANLAKLAKAATVQEAFAQARTSQIVPITPTVHKAEGGVHIRIPADAGYDVTEIFVARATPA